MTQSGKSDAINTPGMDQMHEGVATFDRPVRCRTLGELRLALAPYSDGHKLSGAGPMDLNEPPVLVTLVKVRRGDVLTMVICLEEAEL